MQIKCNTKQFTLHDSSNGVDACLRLRYKIRVDRTSHLDHRETEHGTQTVSGLYKLTINNDNGHVCGTLRLASAINTQVIHYTFNT
jgi:hypothetical protein